MYVYNRMIDRSIDRIWLSESFRGERKFLLECHQLKRFSLRTNLCVCFKYVVLYISNRMPLTMCLCTLSQTLDTQERMKLCCQWNGDILMTWGSSIWTNPLETRRETWWTTHYHCSNIMNNKFLGMVGNCSNQQSEVTLVSKSYSWVIIQ